MIVGVLALQGDVPEHRRALSRLVPSDSVRLVRGPADLLGLDALLLPGGESTAIAKLLDLTGLWKPLSVRLAEGLPVLATCAGLILLAKNLEPSPGGNDPPTFGVLDVGVRRNDYGSQRESFEADVDVVGLGGEPFPGVFIRAPRILTLGPGVEAIARRGDEVVGVRSGTTWGLTFHPELSSDDRILGRFLAEAGTRPLQKAKKSTTRATAVTTRPADTASQ